MSAQRAPAEITDLLLAWSDGDPAAGEEVIAQLYGRLKRIAGRQMARERSDHTLQPTALVHEAFLALDRQRRVRWRSRSHFLAIAARLMRCILVDHARARNRLKRGGGVIRVSLDAAEELATIDGAAGLLALDEALERLKRRDPMKEAIVELRYFGGLSIEQAAEVTGLSTATVSRHWQVARAWLYRQIARGSGPG